MEIKVTGHSFEYELNCVSRLFFPGKPVCFIQRPSGEMWLSSRVLTKNGKSTAYAIYHTPNGVFRCQKSASNSSREEILGIVKHTAFQVLKKSTGISPPWGILTGINPTGVFRRVFAEKGKNACKAFSGKYLVSPEKADLVQRICSVMRSVTSDPRAEASMYISVPFCPTRCSYCSFISVAVEKSKKLTDPYLELLMNEISEKADVLLRAGKKIRSVYVGGGTPGILDEKQTERLLEKIVSVCKTPLAEFNYEIGRPDTVTAGKLTLLKRYGVTRVCINTQTTNNEVLSQIGRAHSASQYFDAMRLTRSFDFDSINTDLIAGLPGESVTSFLQSLKDVLSAGADNITIHTLAIKRSAKLYEDQNNFRARCDAVQEMLNAAYDRLLSKGYLPYYIYKQKNAVSNGGFAKPDKIGKYNLYMMEDLHSIAACGAGASSKIISSGNGRVERVMNVKYPFEYINEYDRVLCNTRLFEEKIKESL